MHNQSHPLKWTVVHMVTIITADNHVFSLLGQRKTFITRMLTYVTVQQDVDQVDIYLYSVFIVNCCLLDEI